MEVRVKKNDGGFPRAIREPARLRFHASQVENVTLTECWSLIGQGAMTQDDS